MFESAMAFLRERGAKTLNFANSLTTPRGEQNSTQEDDTETNLSENQDEKQEEEESDEAEETHREVMSPGDPSETTPTASTITANKSPKSISPSEFQDLVNFHESQASFMQALVKSEKNLVDEYSRLATTEKFYGKNDILLSLSQYLELQQHRHSQLLQIITKFSSNLSKTKTMDLLETELEDFLSEVSSTEVFSLTKILDSSFSFLNQISLKNQIHKPFAINFNEQNNDINGENSSQNDEKTNSNADSLSSIFGIPLASLMETRTDGKILKFVENSLNYLNSNEFSLWTKFSNSFSHNYNFGSSEVIDDAIARFNLDTDWTIEFSNNSIDDNRDGPAIVFEILKRWLVSLPNSLLPWEFYEDLTQTIGKRNTNSKIEGLKSILCEKIPAPNRTILFAFCDFFVRLINDRKAEMSSVCSLMSPLLLFQRNFIEKNSEKFIFQRIQIYNICQNIFEHFHDGISEIKFSNSENISRKASTNSTQASSPPTSSSISQQSPVRAQLQRQESKKVLINKKLEEEQIGIDDVDWLFEGLLDQLDGEEEDVNNDNNNNNTSGNIAGSRASRRAVNRAYRESTTFGLDTFSDFSFPNFSAPTGGNPRNLFINPDELLANMEPEKSTTDEAILPPNSPLVTLTTSPIRTSVSRAERTRRTKLFKLNLQAAVKAKEANPYTPINTPTSASWGNSSSREPIIPDIPEAEEIPMTTTLEPTTTETTTTETTTTETNSTITTTTTTQEPVNFPSEDSATNLSEEKENTSETTNTFSYLSATQNSDLDLLEQLLDEASSLDMQSLMTDSMVSTNNAPNDNNLE